MKTIATLNGVDFLRQCNKIRKEVYQLLKSTNIMEVAKAQPVFTGKETKEEKNKIYEEQAKNNIDAALDVLLDKHAEDTVKLISLLCIEEENDEEPTGVDYIAAGLEILGNQKVMDFLLQSTMSALKIMNA